MSSRFVRLSTSPCQTLCELCNESLNDQGWRRLGSTTLHCLNCRDKSMVKQLSWSSCLVSSCNSTYNELCLDVCGHAFCQPCLDTQGTCGTAQQCPCCRLLGVARKETDPLFDCDQCYDALLDYNSSSFSSCNHVFCRACWDYHKKCPICDAGDHGQFVVSSSVVPLSDTAPEVLDAAQSLFRMANEIEIHHHAHHRSIIFRPWANAFSEVLMSPLAVAASQGRIPDVQRLLESGAAVNESEGSQVDRMSALEAAIFGQHVAVAKELIDLGAVLSSHGPTALHMAAVAGSTDLVEYLVLEKGFDINEERFWGNAISFAMLSPFGDWRTMIPCLRGLGVQVREQDIKIAFRSLNFELLATLLDESAFYREHLAAHSLVTNTLIPSSLPHFSKGILGECATDISQGPIENVLQHCPQFLQEFYQARQVDKKWTQEGFAWLNCLIDDLVAGNYMLNLAGLQRLLFRCPKEVPTGFEFL